MQWGINYMYKGIYEHDWGGKCHKEQIGQILLIGC